MQDDASLLSWVPRLRRYSRALVNNRDDADDLVQDTLERAWAKSGLWGGVADMRAWLFSIMHNLHVDGVRRPRLHTVTMDDDTPEVVRNRLDKYTSQTAPVIDYYRQHGQLTVVDGVGSLDDVFNRLIEALSPAKEVG